MTPPFMSPKSIFIGFDSREADGYAVARFTARRNLITPIPISPILLAPLVASGVYYRPTERIAQGSGRPLLHDTISQAPMSTEFAISRFLTPYLAGRMFNRDDRAGKRAGWALFMDADVMVRRSLDDLFAKVDKRYAVMVVKHKFDPPEGVKMDGQAQLRYARKNWSSVMLFNCDHPSNNELTLSLINNVPGRDLHRFCWLKDEEIGELPPTFNYLVGFHNKEQVENPHIVHFTDGIPSMPGYENCEYAEEWQKALRSWAADPQ